MIIFVIPTFKGYKVVILSCVSGIVTAGSLWDRGKERIHYLHFQIFM